MTPLPLWRQSWCAPAVRWQASISGSRHRQRCGGRNASVTCVSPPPRGRRCGVRSRAYCRDYIMRKRPKLHLVGHDPTDLFDDLDKLRADLAAPLRRERITETFARIPHDRAIELYRHKIGE